jgi:hypothetical protein
MGLFLGLSGVANATSEQTEAALRKFAEDRRGLLEPVETAVELREDEQLLITESPQGHITVFYPDGFLEWDEASQHLSQTLGQPAFSFHIHDGDLWMYVLFSDGRQVDQFNPIPDYWEDISEAEAGNWAGNAAVISGNWPNLEPEKIQNFLRRWDSDGLESGRAYPDDESGFGNEWQLTDFMAKIGLTYPITASGYVGDRYRFKVKRRRI